MCIPEGLSCTGHWTQVTVAGPKFSHVCVGGTSSPPGVVFLTQQPRFTAVLGPGSPWAADTSKTAQDRASGPRRVPEEWAWGPCPPGPVARTFDLALECW